MATSSKQTKCGIGFHGDSERPDVAALVLGATKELHFQAFCKAEPVGPRKVVTVGNGDIYFMDEVACGFTWAEDRGSHAGTLAETG